MALPASPRLRRLRLFAVLALFAVPLLLATFGGSHVTLSREQVRATVDAAGPWGFVIFALLFAAGELMHVPGVVFVAVAPLAFGRVHGLVAAYLAALLSVAVSFLLVRTVGGTPLAAIERPWVRRVLQHLDDRPIRSVFVLRTVLWMAPALNYALALTGLGLRDYLVGSALGLLGPVALIAGAVDWLAR